MLINQLILSLKLGKRYIEIQIPANNKMVKRKYDKY